MFLSSSSSERGSSGSIDNFFWWYVQSFRWSMSGSESGIQYGPFVLPLHGLPMRFSRKTWTEVQKIDLLLYRTASVIVIGHFKQCGISRIGWGTCNQNWLQFLEGRDHIKLTRIHHHTDSVQGESAHVRRAKHPPHVERVLYSSFNSCIKEGNLMEDVKTFKFND